MSSKDDAIQPAPAPQPAPGEIVTPEPPEDNTPLINRLAFLDGVMVLLVLALAFVVTATQIYNSDVFLHLAAGRLIAQGQFTYADPFCFTTSGWWVNHAWLFDLLLYLFHAATGASGVALTVLKALVFTAVAWLIVRAGSKPGERLWIPAVCAALGVLAVGVRPLLNPTMLSVLFTAALMLLLSRHERGSRRIWAAPVVCLLWVNCDAWFFLGPALVLLFLVGKAIQSTQAQGEQGDEPRAELPELAGLFAACLGACLINPYFVWAFTAPPPELHRFGSGAVLYEDHLFRAMWLSPVEGIYFRATFGLSVVGLTVFLLAPLGLVSFALCLDRLQWWRALVFVLGLGLALLTYRAIPLFAVICSVVMSLNFIEASERFLGAQAYLLATWRGWAVSGRALTIVILFALAATSIPGWLQPAPQSRYRFAFGLLVDEGLKDAALQAAAWRDRELLPQGQRWFNTSPEVANYFAWYCPGEKLFIDHRAAAFPPEVAQDYITVRRALAERGKEGREGRDAWKAVLEQHGVRLLAFHSANLAEAGRTLVRLNAQEVIQDGRGGLAIHAEWAVCHISGKAAIFAWQPRGRAAGGLPAFDRRLRLFFDGRAFGPDADLAPDARPPEAARTWYSLLLEEELPSPAETDTAIQYTFRLQGLAEAYGAMITEQVMGEWAAFQVGPAAAASALTGGVAIQPRLEGGAILPGIDWALSGNDLFQLFDRGPPSSLYLSIRAARRALARNPEDPRALLALASAYTQLRSLTREAHPVMRNFPHLSIIRQTQVTAPLQALLRLKAEPMLRWEAHRILEGCLTHPRFRDLRVYHEGEVLALEKQHPELLPNNPEQAAKRLETLNKQHQQNEKEIQQRMNRYDELSVNRTLTQKVAIALQLGLAREALRLMKDATPEELSPAVFPAQGDMPAQTGTYLYLELLLATGQVEDARGILLPPDQSPDTRNPKAFGFHPLGVPAYDFFLLQLHAASGDYEEADKALAAKISELQSSAEGLGYLLPAPEEAAGQRYEMDVLPEKERASLMRPDPNNLGRFVGLALGAYLLREAQRAPKFPWNALVFYPYALQPPHLSSPRIRLPAAGLQAQMRTYTAGMLRAQADQYALRACLALEHGRTANAKEFALMALRAAGNLQVPARAPAGMVLRLLRLGEVKPPHQDAVNP